MERIRGPFEGVWNIVRFNWHLYAWATGLISIGLLMGIIIGEPYRFWLMLLSGAVVGTLLISLLTSYYVYDLSNLYSLSWLDFMPVARFGDVVTIHAGFDETSGLLHRKFPKARLHVFDFYDPRRHTEVSIQRARKAYPPYPATQPIDTSAIPLANQRADAVFLILAAHEIRQEAERVGFFNEINRILKPDGDVIVVEHLRDGANFLAYTIGFLHFLPQSSWLNTFRQAGFTVHRRFRITPFITVFVVRKNDNTA